MVCTKILDSELRWYESARPGMGFLPTLHFRIHRVSEVSSLKRKHACPLGISGHPFRIGVTKPRNSNRTIRFARNSLYSQSYLRSHVWLHSFKVYKMTPQWALFLRSPWKQMTDRKTTMRYGTSFSYITGRRALIFDWTARLGNSGLKVSKIILGCMSYGTQEWEGWVLPEDESIKHIKAAYVNPMTVAGLYFDCKR